MSPGAAHVRRERFERLADDARSDVRDRGADEVVAATDDEAHAVPAKRRVCLEDAVGCGIVAAFVHRV